DSGRGLAIKYLSVISSVVSSVQEIFHRQESLEEKVAIQDRQIKELMRMNLELQEKLENR
ncbi:MAG: hypothetical protein K2Q18_13475, partial [Bdellovibrionales bacterium]|nr:hypothetical protein [Bdellovibrionales bacterium]